MNVEQVSSFFNNPNNFNRGEDPFITPPKSKVYNKTSTYSPPYKRISNYDSKWKNDRNSFSSDDGTSDIENAKNHSKKWSVCEKTELLGSFNKWLQTQSEISGRTQNALMYQLQKLVQL